MACGFTGRLPIDKFSGVYLLTKGVYPVKHPFIKCLLPTLILFNFRFFIQPQNDAYFAKFYMKTYTRAGPYILGSILGYVLHNYKGEKLSSVIICFST